MEVFCTEDLSVHLGCKHSTCVDCGRLLMRPHSRGRLLLRCPSCVIADKVEAKRKSFMGRKCRSCHEMAAPRCSYCKACRPKRRQWQPHPITCPGCKVQFVPVDARRRWCSSECFANNIQGSTVKWRTHWVLWQPFDPSSGEYLIGPGRELSPVRQRVGSAFVECPTCWSEMTQTGYGYVCLNVECEGYRWLARMT